MYDEYDAAECDDAFIVASMEGFDRSRDRSGAAERIWIGAILSTTSSKTVGRYGCICRAEELPFGL